LFAYCRSDKRISQINCYKLRMHLKEISNREERAKMRNLDLLREVERIEMSMKKYQPNHGSLLQLKVTTCQDCSFNKPALLSVMGQQTQVRPSSASSDHILLCSPTRNLDFHQHLPSGLMKDFRAGREDTVSNQAYLSDDISSSNDPPDGNNLSDKHERMKAQVPTVSESVSVQNKPCEHNEYKPSPPVTLTAADERPSSCSSGPMGAEKNSGEKEHTSWSLRMEDAERGFKNSIPKSPTVRLSLGSLYFVIQCLTALCISASLCNSGEDLSGVDPKACGAAVLHELQRLSWSTEKGCLLPLDLVSAHQSCRNPNEISDCLLPDAAQLWDRWFKHALLLKERHVLSTEHLVQLFTPLLLERHATYDHQTPPSYLYPCAPFFPASSPHYVLSFLTELQSSEEDGQDESPVESVPIRGKKALPMPQHSHCSYVVASFWGESDDSYSEIEAALRPQPFNTNDVDSDDFYN
uniref:Centrosomal protein kizuna n=1 Tax=Periophthalmus magnuspinnatus TaxID=409849 RepID=A0A3B4AAJ9_9GOBI